MKRIACIMIVSMLLFSMILFAPLAQSDPGTTLSAKVTATGYWTITYHWTIDKSVTPEAWFLFEGDSGTSQYKIAVTKDAGTEEAYVSGQVNVTNGGGVATTGLAITVVLTDGYPPYDVTIGSASVDVSMHKVLLPGEWYLYGYRVDIPLSGGAEPQPHAGGSYKLTAYVTITNHSGHEGTPFGPSPSATMIFPDSATKINDEINVDDTNGGSWHFITGGSVTYDKTFTCSDESYAHMNTATIQETGQSASATVKVYCYELEVSKDAQTYFTRTYHWRIVKTADKWYLELHVGESADVHYTVTVDVTGYTDSDWGVKEIDGILVHNPAPIAAVINSITDLVSPDIHATVGFTGPYTLAAGADLLVPYTASLPDASSRTNTATATLQNYDYASDGSKTAGGTTDFSSDPVAVDFGDATMYEKDKSVTVSDTHGGVLGTATYGVDTLPKAFTYTRTIGPYPAAGVFYVDNTATFTTSDTGATGSSSWEVEVKVISAATISGLKFYDSNANGKQDSGETGLKGWTIQLLQLDGTVVQEVLTDDMGGYIFENLLPGTYKVHEVTPSLSPPQFWMATTPDTSDPITVPSSGGAFAGPVFGNVKMTAGHGGFTLGFWSNKNGQALITSSDVAMLNSLNLFKPTGWTCPPFNGGSLNAAKTQIKNYLLSATATDMRWMLCAQLIATELDVQHGYLSTSTIVYTNPYNGFMTIGNILTGAISALTGGDRVTQEYYKNLLDGLNNNHFPFVI